MKYKRIPEYVEASQWFQVGDHPAVIKCPDKVWMYNHDYPKDVVGYIPAIDGYGNPVYPSNWVVDIEGRLYVYKDENFKRSFEFVEGENLFFNNLRKLIRLTKTK